VASSEAVRDPGSFRDPSGFVFRRDGVIYRQVNPRYHLHYDLLVGSGLYDELIGDGLMVSHEEVSVDLASTPDAYRVLRPDRIPFLSYPYEWCFSQFKKAALVTLEIQRRAIGRGLILKDASAFNVQFVGTRPVLIDTLSFERYEVGTPWVAYSQFCQHFLAPLLLMSQVDVRLSRLFRTFFEGVPLDLASRLLPIGSWFRFRHLLHVHLHARSIQRFSGTDDEPGNRPGRVSQRGLLGLIESLEGGVRQSSWNPEDTQWAGYEEEHGYDPETWELKRSVVRELIQRLRPEVTWDLGANTGLFSRVASESSGLVVSLDSDPGAVEKQFRSLEGSGEERILPLQVDLINPTPGLGWGESERLSLADRGPADLLLALALVHHLSLSGNVPFDRLAEGLAALGKHLIIEFVPKSDPQAQRLLRSREDVFEGYSLPAFEEAFSRFFEPVVRRPLGSSGRTLYFMERKG
jgi:hypothetical protein